jgi:tetraacyldisaccharide 4'-kinase
MPNQPQTNLLAMLSGQDRSLRGALVRTAAATVEPLYRAAVGIRNTGYDLEWRSVHHAHCPVVSIGNITTGGTGKTPLVIQTVKHLQRLQLRPAILMRGYMTDPNAVSDEAQLLSRSLPTTPVLTGPDRIALADEVRRLHPHVNVLVLDDGFQHRRIARNLDVVLIDAARPFGFDRLLPRGLMREPPASLRRAHAVIITHADMLSAPQRARLDDLIHHYHGFMPIAYTAHLWNALYDQHDRRYHLTGSARRRVFAFCGIGHPQPFFHQAARYFDLADSLPLADHFVYDQSFLDRLSPILRRLKPDALLTTDKDWVKLRPLLESHLLNLPIYRPSLALKWLRGEAPFASLLRDRLCYAL